DPERRLARRVSRLDRVTLQLGVAVAVLIALCSLSVSGIARQRKPSGRGWFLSVSGIGRQRKPSGRGWFFAGGWAWPTEPGSRGNGRGGTGAPALTLAGGGHGRR